MESNQSKPLIRFLKLACAYEVCIIFMTVCALFILKLQDESLYFTLLAIHFPASIVIDPFVHELQKQITLQGNLTMSIFFVHILSQTMNIGLLGIFFILSEDKKRFYDK